MKYRSARSNNQPAAYTTRLEDVSNLTPEERNQLASIYLKYYDASSKELFLTDLDKKDEVIIVNFNGNPVGFTTLQIYTYSWQDTQVLVVFSGDTIIEKPHWGQQALALRWIKRMAELKTNTEFRLYWFLIVKGHRTYRYLPTFFSSFYPHWSIDRDDLKPLADELAQTKFGHFYDSCTGLVSFDCSHGHLAPELSTPNPSEIEREDVRFFLKLNPRYAQGEELVCLAEISESNLRPYTLKIFNRAIA